MGRVRAWLGIVLLAAVWSLALGCREEVPPLFRRNRPPETTLTIVAEESTQSFYRFRVFWRGEDPDGEVVRYLFAITDTLSLNEDDNWDPSLAVDRDRGVFTTRTDSVFFFNSGLGKQALNIVAIDDFGEMDPTPARKFFFVGDNGSPRVRILAVSAANDTLPPCVAAEPCTIPMYTDFRVRFTGTTPNGGILGITWAADLGLWQPANAGADTVFLPLPQDTVVVDADGDTLWTAHGDTITAFYYSDRQDSIASKNWLFDVNVIDDARRTVNLNDQTSIVTVNYDPSTRLFAVPECECPNAPPGCSSNRLVPAGWVSGIGTTRDFDSMSEWRLFCAGDTLPNFSWVTFYSAGADDRRDVPRGPAPSPVDYTFRYEWVAPGDRSTTNMQFSDPTLVETLLPLPGGGEFRGQRISWQVCPFNYLFQAAAVDEHNRIDGTAAELAFVVGGTPVMDSVSVPKVMVFVPSCSGPLAPLCKNVSQSDFGPDTLLVFGRYIENPDSPFMLGSNSFVFPFRAWAHDDPRDGNPPGENYYTSETVGQVRSWRFDYDCVDIGCQDITLPGEDGWQDDTAPGAGEPPGQQVFDDPIEVTIALEQVQDTCNPPFGVRAVLRSARFGRYKFVVEGRDTPFVGLKCNDLSDLGAAASSFAIDFSTSGRTTQVIERETVWLPLEAVRPPCQGTSTVHANSKGFVNSKRLMK